MSYCRFSQDSDVHAFAPGDGRFMVQVAVNATPEISEEEESRMSPTELWKFLNENSQPLNGRLDGQSFEFASAQDMTDCLREVAALGYRVPPDTWAYIQKDHPEVVVGLKVQGKRPRP